MYALTDPHYGRGAMDIPFNKPCIEGGEIENILTSIRSGRIAGDGRFNELCHEEMARSLGAKCVLLTTSASTALELAAMLCDIGPGDEVIMPSFTFVSCANAVCMRGGRPVFVDIDPLTLNLDEALIPEAITERTRAIMPVHYGGVSCEMDVINDIAGRHDLFVIEDAAHAFLSTYRGRYAGAVGDIGCFSFHETKSFTCGEGGALVLNREEHVSRGEILRDKGTNRPAFVRGEVQCYSWVDLGISALPSDILGAILYAQWLTRDKIIAKRKAVHARYAELLAPLEARGVIQLQLVPHYCTTSYYQFCLLTAEAETRPRLLEHLRRHGVHAVSHFVPLHLSPYACKAGLNRFLAVTESVADRIVRLPFYNSISPPEQDHVARVVRDFYHAA